jgi:hypothetical protein
MDCRNAHDPLKINDRERIFMLNSQDMTNCEAIRLIKGSLTVGLEYKFLWKSQRNH